MKTGGSPQKARAHDLVKRMSLEELAGLMFHSNIPSTEPPGLKMRAASMTLTKTQAYSLPRITSTALFADPTKNPGRLRHPIIACRRWRKPRALGIPLTINSNPRSQIDFSPLTNLKAATFSKWPDPTGLAAIGDPALVRTFADIVRREYLAVGIRKASSPQADLATEPRWTRVSGTFGEDARSRTGDGEGLCRRDAEWGHGSCILEASQPS
jgi:beta-glucosidase